MRALVVQNVALEGPGLLAGALAGAGWEPDVRLMEDRTAKLPADLAGFQALVVLGGPMGANDDAKYPYLTRVANLIAQAAADGIPALGICLGAQLMARALGAAIRPNPVKEIGWYPVRLTAEGLASPLFTGLPGEMTVFQWHGDTFDLPEGAVHLAQAPACSNQAFSFRERLFALQFHLEVTPEIIVSWLRAGRDEVTGCAEVETPEEIERRTREVWPAYRAQAEVFLANIVRLLAG
ncbi:MAG: type 1 glutamine amidotransferase [Peptococcaceae bacterium]|nr:type 1 glutamine amidotransferase [Peptococcaceae bacterium]